VAQQTVHSVAADQTRGDVVLVPVARLTTKPSFREAGVNDDHVEQLVTLGGRWPPILVQLDNGLVIDGVHRVAAARLLGLERMAASLFDGDPDEALIEFVRRNVYHGLPLTLRERKKAAVQVLLGRPEWSDRRIAEICALSPKTVGRLRLASPECQAEEIPRLDTRTRVGRDNKSRPVNGASVRARVIEAIKEQPGASLRAVAASVGVSPETVRIVRMKMSRPAATEAVAAPVLPEEAPVLGMSDEADDLAAWWDRTCISEDDCLRRVNAVPPNRVREMADEARRRSEAWLRFARSLDALQQAEVNA